jgi:lipoyl-dependent peroxiredoxin
VTAKLQHFPATWVGDLRRGNGVVTTGSGTLSQSQYFGTGDGEGKGTNPYELIAAAHAACFSMTLADELAAAGFTPQRIATTATVNMELLSAGWTITDIQLDVLAEAPRAKQGDFIRKPRNKVLVDHFQSQKVPQGRKGWHIRKVRANRFPERPAALFSDL